jgi:XamI restriction endonuclease
MAKRVLETVLLGLDRNRFPWVAEDREPNDDERAAAAMASAALIASRRVLTDRANESKDEQEAEVKLRLRGAGFAEVDPRIINTLDDVPELGQFCGEAMFAGRKADIVIRLWDGRAMPTECKVSNSSTNSVKRLNNDAAVKAHTWLDEFGPRHTVPAAVLAGVFKRHNLEDAQDRGLTIFWARSDAVAAESRSLGLVRGAKSVQTGRPVPTALMEGAAPASRRRRVSRISPPGAASAMIPAWRTTRRFGC